MLSIVLDGSAGRLWHTPQYMGFLGRCFNGTGPASIAHPADRRVRAHAQLDQQSGGDGPGTTQTPPAMNHHVEARSESVTDGPARVPPGGLEDGSRWQPIRDRQMPPFHVPMLDGARSSVSDERWPRRRTLGGGRIEGR